jgi:hypothetical protein
MGRFNPRAAKSGFAALIKTGSVPAAFIENKGLNMHQVGFGSEHSIDSIGSYWFYCNASNGFGQKCLVCTTDLSHVTVFRRAETLISGPIAPVSRRPALLPAMPD